MGKHLMLTARAEDQSSELFARIAEALSRTAAGLALEGAEIMIVMGEEDDDDDR